MSRTWNMEEDPITAVIVCDDCDTMATWANSPDKLFTCDVHVPRGCDCLLALKPDVVRLKDKGGNTINPPSDYEYAKDSLGNVLPCQVWQYSEKGFETQVTDPETFKDCPD